MELPLRIPHSPEHPPLTLKPANHSAYCFQEWLSNANHLEYPFDLSTTLAYKFGYGNDLEVFKKEGMKFSLIKDGTLDKLQCTKLLLVNGVGDE